MENSCITITHGNLFAYNSWRCIPPQILLRKNAQIETKSFTFGTTIYLKIETSVRQQTLQVMKITRIIIPGLILTLFGCGESFDKLKKTEEIVNQYDKKNDGKFFIEASIEGDKSELNVTLEHKPFLAYYTNALYEIILELHEKNISYNHYYIKDSNKTVIWEVEDSQIPEIKKIVSHSKRLMKLLYDRKYDEFLSFSNLQTLGVSDSVFLTAIEQNPVYPNTQYKGFSIMEKEINGVKREFMFFFFMNNENKQNMLVLDPKDQLVYGLEY